MSFPDVDTYYHVRVLFDDETLSVEDTLRSVIALYDMAEQDGNKIIKETVEIWTRKGDDRREVGFFVGDTSTLPEQDWVKAV